jgi:hypothetical protein
VESAGSAVFALRAVRTSNASHDLQPARRASRLNTMVDKQIRCSFGTDSRVRADKRHSIVASPPQRWRLILLWVYYHRYGAEPRQT